MSVLFFYSPECGPRPIFIMRGPGAARPMKPVVGCYKEVQSCSFAGGLRPRTPRMAIGEGSLSRGSDERSLFYSAGCHSRPIFVMRGSRGRTAHEARRRVLHGVYASVPPPGTCRSQIPGMAIDGDGRPEDQMSALFLRKSRAVERWRRSRSHAPSPSRQTYILASPFSPHFGGVRSGVWNAVRQVL